MRQTVEQAVLEHFADEIADQTYIPNINKDRLFGHDVVHVMLGANGGGRGEEIVGIYQAVMLGDLDVDKYKKHWRDEGISLSLRDIREAVVPAVREYIQSVAGQTWSNGLTDEQVAEHYRKAVLLRRLFYAEFERNIGDIPADELRAMPFEPFREVAENMELAYRVHYHCVSANAYHSR